MLMNFKVLLCKISKWVDRYFGTDRLSTRARIIQPNSNVKNSLNDFKKSYYLYKHTNIAISGGEASGKKSLVETFENTRWFPIGKFVHIDIRRFMNTYGHITDKQSLQAALDKYIEDCILTRVKAGQLPGLTDRLIRGTDKVYKKPLVNFMILIIACYVLCKKDQWSILLENLLPVSWNIYVVILTIICCCWIIIVLCALSLINTYVAFSPVKRFNGFKVTIAKKMNIEIPVEGTINRNDYNQTTIYIMWRLRWQIGHTVVFDNLEQLGEGAFQKIVLHLCELNDSVNCHGGYLETMEYTPF